MVDHTQLVDLFMQGIPAGAAIARFDEAKSPAIRQAFLKLLGSDLQRIALSRYLLEVEKAFTEPGLYMTQSVANISKMEAFRTYSLFPRFILPEVAEPQCREEREEFAELQRFYLESGLFLINWEKNSRYSEQLKKLALERAEKRAWVSRKLFALCDYMKMHSNSPYFKPLTPAAMWLFCEVSICKNRLSDKHKEGSKRKRYERMLEVYGRLDNQDPALMPNSRPTKDIKDFAEHFFGYFLYKVHQMAEADPEFDSVLFRDYMKTARIWGKEALSATGPIAYM